MREKILIRQKKNLRSLSLIVGLFLLILLTTSIVSAYARQNIAYTPTAVPYTGQAEFPLFDRSMCGAGQDFIMQISPIGCTPSVVRSDLLEDQNVPIFCPITATQLNPLIDIEAIKTINMHLNGSSPYIQGISYLPARAALGKYGGEVNSPVLNNLGYAVIILKQQRNQTTMPDSVSGNLVAKIRYDIKNAFGVGQANFYLPELNDEEWENTFTQYGFWDGRGYLRAEGIDEDSASISIYSDRETYGFGKSGEKRKLSSMILNVGEESPEIPMPGFDYCLGSMKLKLNGLETPGTRIKLNINGDVVEVKENEKFLDNKCQVRDMDKQGIVQKTTIRCDTDDGRKTFPLVISPRINLSIDGASKEYGVGDRLYTDKKGEKTIYLVYISTKGDSRNEEDLFIVTAAIPGIKDRLAEEEMISISNFIKKQESIGKTNTLAGITLDVVKTYLSAGESVLRYIVQGQGFRTIYFGIPEEISEKQVSLLGFVGARDIELSEDIKDYYERAIDDYDDVIDSFSSEKYPSEDTRTLGEKALIKKIEFAEDMNQKRTTAELCEEFENNYPNSAIPLICNEVHKLSSPESAVRDVEIDGRIKRISFDGIREPTFKEFGINLLVKDPQGKITTYDLRKDDILYLDESETHFVQIVDLDEDSAKFRVNLEKTSAIENVKQFVTQVNDVQTLKLDFPNDFGSQYLFTLQTINLKKLAKVSVIPNVKYSETQADFSFKIGIEKRGIQLSPEKAAEKIESLNQTISKWENINEKLGKVVTGFKYGCLGVGAGLTVKNFLDNLQGRGVARNKVMRGDAGWFEICETSIDAKSKIGDKGPWTDIDSCLLDNSDAINAAVDVYANAMEKQNEEFEILQELHKIKGGFLSEDVINTDAVEKDFIDKFFNELDSNLVGVNTIKVGGKDVDVSKIVDEINPNTVSLTQVRNLLLNSRLLSSSDENVKNIALSQINSDLGDIWVNSENIIERQDVEERYGIPATIGSSNAKLIEFAITKVETFENAKSKNNFVGGENINDESFVHIYKDKSNAKEYLLILDNDYVVQQTHQISGNVLTLEGIKVGEETDPNPLGLAIEYFDSTTYKNKYNNAEIKYYETAPYKGLPAIVPFDIKNGWYAAIKSTLPIGGNIKAYDDSGRISSFWLCNIGQNKREEFNSGIGDDVCEMINLGTGQPYNQFYGLEKSEASRIVSCAIDAIEDASSPGAYSAGVRSVRISTSCGGTLNIKVGNPAINIPDIECQDFMSPSDCNLLFNVCDPVVCPSSRCDLGGTYPVKDVVQSGIIGSLALCLPNFPEVKVPICLSGVHAGLESYLTVLNSHQECLQTSLETGQTVGICDEIYSIHMCEFFWRQALPLAEITIPKVIGAVLGQNVRGGGEYLGVQDAWQRASDSVDYFTQYYAANSFKGFKARTAEGVGTEVCKGFVSLTTPQGGNLLDALVAPDSPSQFYGRFDEIPFTTATNPPTSHYKVFYHIYAGKDLPAYFQVYLHGTGSSFFQDTTFRRIVAQGFIKAGEYETQTIDFTAPSGYQEMCIVVNGQEECGFKQVTTDFGINYITEQYVASQAKQIDIRTEAACVSGTPSMYSLLSPNLQAGAEEMVNPAIYNRGITRICATDDPGKTTDPAAGTNKSRWQPVGYCGNEGIKCWLDTRSVKDTIKSTKIEGEVLGEVGENYLDVLKKEYGYVEDFDALVEEIEAETSAGQIEKINENYDRVFYNHEKGYLTLLRADAYAWLASSMKTEIEPIGGSDAGGGSGGSSGGGVSIVSVRGGFIDSCIDCGKGIVNPCDEEECLAIGERMGKECIFKRTFLGLANQCIEKEEEEICSIEEECKKYLGEIIVELAKTKKGSINDADVKADTGAESFECLVLQVAYAESGIRHCKQYRDPAGNPLYCDGDRDELIAGDGGDSLGVMQINTQVHSNVDVADFEENVNKGIDLLIQNYNPSEKIYECYEQTEGDFVLVNYKGWKRALRAYNGWNSPPYCNSGNPNYVDDVISYEGTIKGLFPEICS